MIKFKPIALMLALGAFYCQGAFASQVTLYGKIDEGLLVGKTRHGDATFDVKSGFTAGSRWGIKGVEDLGNGLKVGFILEQGYNVDDGAAASSTLAFNRETALYVDGGFGRLTYGRLGTLGFAQSTGILRGAIFGVTHGASGWASGTTSLHFSRVDNAVAYKTPSFGGVTLHAMYSNGTNTDDSKNKWSENNHYYGLGALYSSKTLSGSVIFETIDYKGVDEKTKEPLYHVTIGGWWQIGMFRPMAIYQYQWGENRYKQHAAQVGSQIKLGGGTAKLGFKYVTRKIDGTASKIEGEKKGNLWNVGAGYEYPLSKRTKVYGFAGYTDGGKGWGKGKNLTTTNLNGYQIAVGMVHDF